MIDFVKTTTNKSNPNFVPPEDRIATFDQDGTTWASHSIYSQVLSANSIRRGKGEGWTVISMKNDWNQIFAGPAK